MKIEAIAGSAFSVLLAGSAAHAARRRHVERGLRAAGSTGNRLHELGDGTVEYRRWSGPHADAPIVICENGLGAPLETWDWTAPALAAHCHVLAYHRPGYGATTTAADVPTILRRVLTAEFGELSGRSRLVFVAHSIGGMAARAALTDIAWIAPRTRAVVFVDSTDPSQLRSAFDSAERFGKLTQSLRTELIGAVLGTSAVANDALAEFDHRASTQQRIARFLCDPRTVRTATREMHEYSRRADEFAAVSLPPALVISAERSREGSQAHLQSQSAMAAGLRANHEIVEQAAHRSILGFVRHGHDVADRIVAWLSSAAPVPRDQPGPADNPVVSEGAVR